MDTSVLQALVSSIGFPIAVAVYVLVRLDSSIRDMRTALMDLTDELRTGNRAPRLTIDDLQGELRRRAVGVEPAPTPTVTAGR